MELHSRIVDSWPSRTELGALDTFINRYFLVILSYIFDHAIRYAVSKSSRLDLTFLDSFAKAKKFIIYEWAFNDLKFFTKNNLLPFSMQTSEVKDALIYIFDFKVFQREKYSPPWAFKILKEPSLIKSDEIFCGIMPNLCPNTK